MDTAGAVFTGKVEEFRDTGIYLQLAPCQGAHRQLHVFSKYSILQETHCFCLVVVNFLKELKNKCTKH